MNGPLNIAVADDEPRMREYYRESLARMGHRVAVAASSGRELIDGCRATPPDLILTDIKMPDVDGIDAAVEIGKGGPIPVILVSAYHEDDLLDRASGAHVFGFLVKPIKHDDLKAAIAIAMQRFAEVQDALARRGRRTPPGPRRPQVHRAGQGRPDEEGRPRRGGGLQEAPPDGQGRQPEAHRSRPVDPQGRGRLRTARQPEVRGLHFSLIGISNFRDQDLDLSGI